MALILGFDTSNYTTSAACLDTSDFSFSERHKLLPVKQGERGIRQSDAVFHHTTQLPTVLDELTTVYGKPIKPDIVCCSVSPTPCDGSYMPCFLVGKLAAKSVASSGCEYIETTHQEGHIYAALISAGKLDLLKNKTRFMSFHVSGGTTDCLLCEPEDKRLKITPLSGSLDLKAGQAIDRVGVALGLSFPCGIEIEKLALKSEKSFNPKIYIKDGCPSLSGIENKCLDMIKQNASREDTALYCLMCIYKAVYEVTDFWLKRLGSMPIVYAGGVMSDKIIKDKLTLNFKGTYFAAPEFSRDNALGICVAAAHKKGLIK